VAIQRAQPTQEQKENRLGLYNVAFEKQVEKDKPKVKQMNDHVQEILKENDETREQSDEILAFEAMPDLGASKFVQRAVYLALRIFGRSW
jgi:hypothetical protein